MRKFLRSFNCCFVRTDIVTRTIKVALATVLIVSLFGFAGCINSNSNAATSSGNSGSIIDLGDAPYDPYTKKDGTWAIYWYLCGSDIELRSNIPYTATGQVQEMMNVTLPDNVTVVIQTGGAQSWHDNWADPSLISRFVYRGNTLTLVDTQPLASMGESQTLADFLTFCNQNYPAEKQVFEIADHGGGSIHGIAYDNLFNMNSLSLQDVEHAMRSRPAASGAYELVSLSACLMSTIDTIAALNGLTRYLVASEEVQLGCFWDYETFFGPIAKDTTINGATLGRAISDGYRAQCEQAGYTSYTTISVIDMAQADKLLEAYNNVGIELLKGAVENGAETMTLFGRAAHEAENYGATNSPTSNYDMVDLGDLVTKAQALLPNSSAAMLQAITNAVIYHVANPQRAEGKGISCYFPYTGNMKGFETFSKISSSPAFVYYYDYGLNGQLSNEGQAYLTSLTTAPVPKPQPLPQPSTLGFDNHVLYIGDEWYSKDEFVLELGDDAKYAAEIYLQVGVWDRDAQNFWVIGTSKDIYSVWEEGIFCSWFNGWWGCIDGATCYMEAIAREQYAVLYRVPVLHNGVSKNLMVEYRWTAESYDEGNYHILGLLSQSNYENASAKPVFEELKVGDVIEPTYLFNSRYSFEEGSFVIDDDKVSWNPREKITVTKETSFYEKRLGLGDYLIRFQIIDYTGAVHYSEPGIYTITPPLFDVEPHTLAEVLKSREY